MRIRRFLVSACALAVIAPTLSFASEDMYLEATVDELTEAATRVFGSHRGGAAYELAQRYLTGDGVERDLEQYRTWLRSASSAGSSAARMELAENHLQGRFGFVADARAAYELLRQAQDNDHPEAFTRMARMYEMGEGVARDVGRAEALYRAAHERGDEQGTYELASLLDARGDKVAADQLYGQVFRLPENFLNRSRLAYAADNRLEGDEWLRQAVAERDPAALRTVAEFYEQGTHGFEKSAEQAFYWHYQAALEGDGPSMHAVAFAFWRGVRGARDELAAAHWYHKGAMAGHRPSQKAYAWMLKQGFGVETDLAAAAYWSNKETP